jgi:hypothetical protein
VPWVDGPQARLDADARVEQLDHALAPHAKPSVRAAHAERQHGHDAAVRRSGAAPAHGAQGQGSREQHQHRDSDEPTRPHGGAGACPLRRTRRFGPRRRARGCRPLTDGLDTVQPHRAGSRRGGGQAAPGAIRLRRRLVRRDAGAGTGRPQPCGERRDGGVWRGAELRPDERRVRAQVFESAGPVAGGLQPPSECDRAPALQRSHLRQSSPVRQRPGRVAYGVRGPRELVECRDVPRRHPRALALGPPLELRRITQKEAIEEWPRVDRDGAGGIAPPQRGLEGGDVAGQHGRVEPQRIRAREGRRVLELVAKRVKHLPQGAPRPLGVALGPENRQQAIAADPLIAGRGDDREQRQRLALGARAGARPLRAVQREAAEGPQPVHVPPEPTRRRCRPAGSALRRRLPPAAAPPRLTGPDAT